MRQPVIEQCLWQRCGQMEGELVGLLHLEQCG